jgi:hypothetical protein
VYTLTDKRVVMRIGMVLTVTFNLPYAGSNRPRCAPARRQWRHLPAAGCGRPHRLPAPVAACRPWQLKRPQPALRVLADARAVARVLGTAWPSPPRCRAPAACRHAWRTGRRPSPQWRADQQPVAA